MGIAENSWNPDLVSSVLESVSGTSKGSVGLGVSDVATSSLE